MGQPRPSHSFHTIYKCEQGVFFQGLRFTVVKNKASNGLHMCGKHVYCIKELVNKQKYNLYAQLILNNHIYYIF